MFDMDEVPPSFLTASVSWSFPEVAHRSREMERCPSDSAFDVVLCFAE